MSYISANLNFLLTAVKKAAGSLTRDFSEIERLQSAVRGHREFAKMAYDRVSQSLRTELQKGRPDYAVVIGGENRPNTPHFLISPLDGVLNFMHGIPYFAVSVAVSENGKLTAAVIFNPATQDMYFAEQGGGAFKEGYRSHERLRVSARKDVSDALIGTLNAADVPPALENIRIQGSVALDLAYAASGFLDAVIAKDCDAASLAAGILLIKEAGGYVYDPAQKDIRTDNPALAMAGGSLLAVNGELGKKLHAMLNK